MNDTPERPSFRKRINNLAVTASIITGMVTAGCSESHNIQAAELPTYGEKPGITETIVPTHDKTAIPIIPTHTLEPTKTPTKELTATSTEQPELKAGIPETFEACNKIDMPVKKDGTFDPDAMANILDKLTNVEKQWLTDQGITVDMIEPLISVTGRVESTASIPYSQIWITQWPMSIVSCSQFMFEDRPYLMFGVAFKANDTSKDITILHGVYDDVGSFNMFKDLKHEDQWTLKNTREGAFKRIQYRDSDTMLRVFLGRDIGERPEYNYLWPLTHAIVSTYPIGYRNEEGFKINPSVALAHFTGFDVGKDLSSLEPGWLSTIERTLYSYGFVQETI
ncbi:MAG: hypothetical protein C0391_02200 [Anaerolinea sp.]|nr:hypothetical protein [Anaerolinea sp.]